MTAPPAAAQPDGPDGDGVHAPDDGGPDQPPDDGGPDQPDDDGPDDDDPPDDGALPAGGGPDTGYLGRRRVRLDIDDCPPRPDLPASELLAVAAERYDRGAILYLQGDYQGAINELVQAYCIASADLRWRVLKDIGQAYERMVDYERAVAYFERYVLEMPAGATRLLACDADPAVDRRNITSRIQILQKLPSTVQVATEPPGATVVIADDSGPQANGRDETALEVRSGTYTLAVDKAGFEPIRRTIEVGIGRPYSYSFRLTPLRGRLSIQAVPGDARIFVDDRLGGIGTYEGEVTLGDHKISVEARGRTPSEQVITVLDGPPTRLSVELEPPVQRGRRQLIIASAAIGGLVGVSGTASATENAGAALFGLLAGGGVGAVGGYFVIPEDITLGESSYIITSTLAGAADGALIGSLIADNPTEGADTYQAQLAGGIGAGGAVVGAAFAVATAGRIDPSPGDAALFNSGVVWGAVTGSLFTAVFDSNSRIETAIALTGVNLGLVTGALLARRYEVSRRRVVFIDLAGIAGITAGAALSSAIDSARDVQSSSESTAHFALGGMALGLGLGTYLTRNLDVPKLPRMAPQVTPGRDPAGGRSWLLGVTGEL